MATQHLEKAGAHLKDGAKRIIISTPFASASMFIMGGNHEKNNTSLKIPPIRLWLAEQETDWEDLLCPHPQYVGCGSDLLLENAALCDDIKNVVKQTSQDHLKGILCCTEDQLIQTIVTHSSTSDAEAVVGLNGHFVKLNSWYNSEFVYCNRVVDFLVQGIRAPWTASPSYSTRGRERPSDTGVSFPHSPTH
ncbi:LOW QUALITY PROTEIN: Glyceraldehyde-3-phosphate dehydrogenase [Galemys pyrenaicus]|uniref:Glyceraldehyde-3-phosphate dehydrogenase n=1 Tax=Galemys pyrenaicus TaxID=202257 RepID=A0A8J6DYP5_GALPY|nr:LOW QUALITY PROTEIN: Glyceraldehyde-3-phosphate dehydrogenase [Galemys pyrenaicus]